MDDITPVPTDNEIVDVLRTAGVEFMRFNGGISGTRDVWTTSGSQDVKDVANGVRAAIARWGAQPAPAASPAPLTEREPVARILLDCKGKPTTRPELLVEPELAEPDAFDAAYPHRAPHRIALLYPELPPAQQTLYRLLERGRDTIQADDEFLREDGVTWRTDPSGIFVGCTYGGNILLPARRAIEATPSRELPDLTALTERGKQALGVAREPVAPFDLTGLRSAAYSANVALLNIIEKGLHGVAYRFSAAGNEEGLRGCQSCAAVVRDIRRTAIAAPTNLSPEMPDQQRQDLLVASFCIASVGDPSATIKPEDAERIITLLHELGGITSKEGGPSAE